MKYTTNQGDKINRQVLGDSAATGRVVTNYEVLWRCNGTSKQHSGSFHRKPKGRFRIFYNSYEMYKVLINFVLSCFQVLKHLFISFYQISKNMTFDIFRALLHNDNHLYYKHFTFSMYRFYMRLHYVNYFFTTSVKHLKTGMYFILRQLFKLKNQMACIFLTASRCTQSISWNEFGWVIAHIAA